MLSHHALPLIWHVIHCSFLLCILQFALQKLQLMHKTFCIMKTDPQFPLAGTFCHYLLQTISYCCKFQKPRVMFIQFWVFSEKSTSNEVFETINCLMFNLNTGGSVKVCCLWFCQQIFTKQTLNQLEPKNN